jgi:hypothetical protein
MKQSELYHDLKDKGYDTAKNSRNSTLIYSKKGAEEESKKLRKMNYYARAVKIINEVDYGKDAYFIMYKKRK